MKEKSLDREPTDEEAQALFDVIRDAVFKQFGEVRILVHVYDEDTEHVVAFGNVTPAMSAQISAHALEAAVEKDRLMIVPLLRVLARFAGQGNEQNTTND